MKIALLTNIIPPYRIPFFNAIAQKLPLEVLICADNEINRKWNVSVSKSAFKTVRLRGPSFTVKQDNDYRFIYLKFSVIWYLIVHRPDIVIIGDASLTSYLTAVSSLFLKIRYVWWSEMTLSSPLSKNIVMKLRKFLIKRACHVFVSGAEAGKYIMKYIVDENRITVIPDVVDNDFYFALHDKHKSQKSGLKRAMGFSHGDFIMIYVGQFILRKRVMELARAFKIIKTRRREIKLMMVGDGIEKAQILNFIDQNKLRDTISVESFKDAVELAKYYTVSDALILISKHDPWGLVVNEALCFGIPAIVSEGVGAAPDLINQITGIIIPEREIGDPGAFAESLIQAADCFIQRGDKSSEIKNVISTWNVKIAADRVMDCVSRFI